ncbi:MAG: M20/M25/M40 family metallo-hydrolase [Nitrososphaerota archaeon]|nr:M20/M25/M40 family metallo-hydrolase [Nitrososphaerota archaeon]MDG7051363.1 M20/M25/M40 family metallo-hydrolase [Nitrososphaerota archaeon]
MKDMEEVEFLSRLIGIYSPSDHEAEISDFIYDHLKGVVGFSSVERDDVANVIAHVKEGRPMVYLFGHMDTVEGNLRASIDERYIRGRGAVDAKGPLGALVYGARGALDAGAKCGITLALLVDEEGMNRGIKRFIETRDEPDFAIFGEPSGVNQVAIGYKGRLLLKVDIESRPYHAASPWLGSNSIDIAMETINSINGKLADINRGAEGYFDKVTAVVTKFVAGDSLNRAPALSQFFLDIRYPPGLSRSDIIDKLNLRGPNLKYEVMDLIEPTLTRPSNELCRAFSRSIYKVTGSKGAFVKKTGTSDGNVFYSKYKVPLVAYGPGDSRLAHTDDEVLAIDEYMASIAVVKETLIELGKITNGPTLSHEISP